MDKNSELARAIDYPYAHLPLAFMFRDGAAHELGEYSAAELIGSGCWPVLGVGSNCAVEQLARKFAGAGGVWPPLDGHAITVVPARLRHFDVVYAATIAGYGSIPATLQGSPGTTVGICVTFLGERELRRMHETEAIGRAYDFVRLGGGDASGGGGDACGGLDLTLSNGERLSEAWIYSACRGCLVLDGGNVALSAMRAEGRRLPALSQREVLTRVWREYGARRHGSVEEFVLALIEDPQYRGSSSSSFAHNEFDSGSVAAVVEAVN